jgi:hypothetical protein
MHTSVSLVPAASGRSARFVESRKPRFKLESEDKLLSRASLRLLCFFCRICVCLDATYIAFVYCFVYICALAADHVGT